MTTYPATRIVHTPNGEVPCCDTHAAQVTGLFRFLGAHIVHTAASPSDQCTNCINEKKEDADPCGDQCSRDEDCSNMGPELGGCHFAPKDK